MLEGFVSGVVLFEQRSGAGKGLVFVGDDSGGSNGSNVCGGARVDRWDENGGGEGAVDNWGDRYI